MDFEKTVEYELCNSAFGNTLLETYEIEKTLSEGPFSTIFLLFHMEYKIHFTLKAVRKSKVRDQDVALLKSLQHLKIVPVVEAGESDHYHYILKPFIEGETLLSYVKNQGPLTGKQLNVLRDDLISIFAYLHSQEPAVVYGDLKPEHIIVSGDGFHLIDIMTLHKELALSDDQATDIYDMGSVLYYGATGLYPKSDEKKMTHQLKACHVEDKMLAFILKCLSTDQDIRFSSVRAMKPDHKKFKYILGGLGFVVAAIILISIFNHAW